MSAEIKKGGVQMPGTAVEQPTGAEPKLIMGVVPCLNTTIVYSAWSKIKDAVASICKQHGDFTEYEVMNAIYHGAAFLYIGYVSDNQEEMDFATANEANANALVMKKIDTDAKGFAGFCLVRLDPKAPHIWMAHVPTEYAGTNIFELGLQAVLDKFKKIGAPYVTFSTMRRGWERVADALGFQEAFTIYRKEL